MAKSFPMPHTFAQKVLAKAAGLPQVAVGQIVTIKPAHLLTHDNTSAIVGKIDKDLAEFGLVSRDLPIIVVPPPSAPDRRDPRAANRD